MSNRRAKQRRKPSISDQDLLVAIREVIAESCSTARVISKSGRNWQKETYPRINRRVNRLMRENNLLSPYRHTCEVKMKEHKAEY
jgi:transposase InsO family protein